MSLPDQKFLEKWERYYDKIHNGKYLEQHVSDTRNDDPIQDRIRLDTDSRLCVAYLNELILMCNQIRMDCELEVLP